MLKQTSRFVKFESTDNNYTSINGLSAWLQETLKGIIKEEGYIECNVEKRTVSTDGGNFLATLYEIDIEGATKDGFKETHLFIKEAKVINKIRIISIGDVFSNETYFYKELADIFNRLQNEANVPDEERFQLTKGYKESSEKAIILENLARRGYKTISKIDGMSLQFARLAVQQLGKFHGLSFVLRGKMPEYYDRNVKSKKASTVFDDDWRRFITNVCDKIVQILDCDILRDKNDETAEVVVLDYQLIHHGCPVTDLLHFVFSSTDSTFRRRHLEHLKCLYHDTVTSYLKHFGIDVDSVFSRELCERMYGERMEFGLMTGVYVSFFQFVRADDLPDIENELLSEFHINPRDEFGDWVRGLIDDFVQWGYL